MHPSIHMFTRAQMCYLCQRAFALAPLKHTEKTSSHQGPARLPSSQEAAACSVESAAREELAAALWHGGGLSHVWNPQQSSARCHNFCAPSAS